MSWGHFRSSSSMNLFEIKRCEKHQSNCGKEIMKNERFFAHGGLVVALWNYFLHIFHSFSPQKNTSIRCQLFN